MAINRLDWTGCLDCAPPRHPVQYLDGRVAFSLASRGRACSNPLPLRAAAPRSPVHHSEEGEERAMSGSRITNASAVVAVLVAFLVGGLVSLAIRPPGGEGAADRMSAADVAARRIHWRLPLSFQTTMPVLGDNPIYVTEMLRASSAGAVDIRIFEPGEGGAGLGHHRGGAGRQGGGGLHLARLRSRADSLSGADRCGAVRHGALGSSLPGGLKVVAVRSARPSMPSRTSTPSFAALPARRRRAGFGSRSTASMTCGASKSALPASAAR